MKSRDSGWSKVKSISMVPALRGARTGQSRNTRSHGYGDLLHSKQCCSQKLQTPSLPCSLAPAISPQACPILSCFCCNTLSTASSSLQCIPLFPEDRSHTRREEGKGLSVWHFLLCTTSMGTGLAPMTATPCLNQFISLDKIYEPNYTCCKYLGHVSGTWKRLQQQS